MVSVSTASSRGFYIDFGSLLSDGREYRNGVMAEDVRNADLADSPLTGVSMHTFVLSGLKDSGKGSSNLSFTWRSNAADTPYDRAYASPVDWVNQNVSIGNINSSTVLADGYSELQVDGMDPSKRYTVSVMVNALSLNLGFVCGALDGNGSLAGSLSGSYAFNDAQSPIGHMNNYSTSQVLFDQNQIGWYYMSFDVSEAESFALRVAGTLPQAEGEPMPYEIAGLQVVEHGLVPEPAAGVLVFSGLAALALRRRRL